MTKQLSKAKLKLLSDMKDGVVYIRILTDTGQFLVAPYTYRLNRKTIESLLKDGYVVRSYNNMIVIGDKGYEQ